MRAWWWWLGVASCAGSNAPQRSQARRPSRLGGHAGRHVASSTNRLPPEAADGSGIASKASIAPHHRSFVAELSRRGQRAGARGCQASASATRRNRRQRSARVCCHAVSRLPAEISFCEAKFQTTTWWQIERLPGRSSSGLRAVTALISLAGV